jgi:hypothetical protein
VRLAASALEIQMVVDNCGDQPMPFSLGLHPYFNVSRLEVVRFEGLPSDMPGSQHHEAGRHGGTGCGAGPGGGSAGAAHRNLPPIPAVGLVDPEAGTRLELQLTPPLDLVVIWTDPPRSHGVSGALEWTPPGADQRRSTAGAGARGEPQAGLSLRGGASGRREHLAIATGSADLQGGVKQGAERAITQELGGGAITHHRALPQQHTPADLGDDRVDLVGHQQDGGARLGKTPQDGQELVSGPQIEGVGGFIEHQHLRVMHQGPGQQEAAPLTIGKLTEGSFRQRLQAEPGHELPHPLPLGARWAAG